MTHLLRQLTDSSCRQFFCISFFIVNQQLNWPLSIVNYQLFIIFNLYTLFFDLDIMTN